MTAILSNVKNTGRTGRIAGFDFARAVSAIGIFAVHYIQETGFRADVPRSTVISAQQWGFIFVTVFFIMSGALLERRYASTDPAGAKPEGSITGRADLEHADSGRSLKLTAFYKKRAASIYPAFYLVYILAAAAFIAAGKKSFSQFLRPQILFTVFGVDGYFASTFDTCYLIGEWFLGALIFLYILFPLLSRLIRKNELITWAAALILYFCFIGRPLLSQAPVTNIFSCLICFMFGITFSRHRLYASGRLIIPGIALFIISLIPWIRDLTGFNISSHLAGTGLFIILFYAGSAVMGRKLPGKVFSFIGGLSYPFYLVHHVIIGAGLNYLFRHIAGTEHPWRYAPAAAAVLFAVSLAAAWVVDGILKLLKRRRA